MKTNLKNFNIKFNEEIPVDKFIEKALYTPKVGYYSSRIPFGKKGDFITAPTISNLFSEIIAIWIVSTWEIFGKPEKFNLVELGPGDGSLTKVLLETFKKFPKIKKATNIFLYEKSNFLKNLQKRNIKNKRVKWIDSFDNIKNGPIIFFGNEFFDAIPIKQFLIERNTIKEKYYLVNNLGLNEIYREAKPMDISIIKSFKVFDKAKFIEYPKLGLSELNKIIEKISKLSGGVLLIDYGKQNLINKNTLQLVMKNKKIKIDNLIESLGKADITSLVNFSLLKEYFIKKNLNVEKIVSQKFFLEKMGIIERAKILEKKMSLKQKDYMFTTLKRLLDKNLMGELFKVIFAFKSNKQNFLGFK